LYTYGYRCQRGKSDNYFMLTFYDKLGEAGMKIVKGPEFNKRFNIYHFFLKDPNGYTLEIQKFLY